MIFKETTLKGAYLIYLDLHEDERGFFARTFCEEEFKAHGLQFKVAQSNLSLNNKKGTLRGMHYQSKPDEEAKVLQCVRGAIYDVIIDLRPESSTFKQWCAFEFSHKNKQMLFIPEGFAHGFQTLEDETEVSYLMSAFYRPESARGVLWNDKAFDISWPIATPIMSAKDRSYAPFN